MDLRDIGLLALILTWIDTLVYSIYINATRSIPITSYQNIVELGKDPILFMLNLILFYISIFTLLKYGGERKETIKKIFWGYPLANIFVALIYSLIISGLSGINILIEAPFITMYSFLTLLTIFLVDLNIIQVNLMEYIKEKKLIVTLTLELAAYIAVRISIGAHPIITTSFFILAILTITIFILKK